MRTATMLVVFAASFSSFAPVSFAQITDHSQAVPSATLENNWAAASELQAGAKVKIVLVAAPKQKRSCIVSSADAMYIACSRSLGRKPVAFREQDIAAIFTPGKGSTVNRGFAVCETIAAGIIAGAVFLGTATSPIGLIGAIPIGLVGVGVAGVCAIADDNVPSVTKPKLIYRRAGLQLDGVPS